jgi:hypothetical protein
MKFQVIPDQYITEPHGWRKSIGLSITKNYYTQDYSFFDPHIHNLYNGNGEICLEFPLLYYLTAQIWKITGIEIENVYSWIALLFFFMGSWHLLKFSGFFLNHSFFRGAIVYFTYAVPLFWFYGLYYMTDAIALSAGFSASYFLYNIVHKERKKLANVMLFMFFLSISGILRLPVLIFPLAFFISLFLIEVKKIKRKNLVIMSFLFSLLVISAWYGYALSKNDYYIAKPGQLGIWNFHIEQSMMTIKEIFRFSWKHLGVFFHPAIFGLFSLLSLWILFTFRGSNLLKWTFIFMAVGGFLYVMLWWDIFPEHDYYLFPIVGMVPAFFILLFHWVEKEQKRVLYYTCVSGISIVFFLSAIDFYTRYEANRKGQTRGILANLWLNDYEKGVYWFFYEETLRLRDWKEFSASLHRDSIAFLYSFSYPDTGIVLPDPSPVKKLVLLDVYGWSNYNSSFTEKKDFDKYKLKGAKYIFVSDSSYWKSPDLEEFFSVLLYRYRGKKEEIRIYKL